MIGKWKKYTGSGTYHYIKFNMFTRKDKSLCGIESKDRFEEVEGEEELWQYPELKCINCMRVLGKG